jgi:hypothetical protein
MPTLELTLKGFWKSKKIERKTHSQMPSLEENLKT